MDRRGISPVVATIILIAAAVAAAAIVAVYVSGLYVGRTAVVAGTIDGVVYDNDPTSLENYKNENVLIYFATTQGYLRDVGDPNDGLTVAVGSSRNGWGEFIASVRGQVNYDKGYVESSGVWTGDGLPTNSGIRWTLYVPVTTAGRLQTGSTAFLRLWALDNAENIYGPKLQPTKKVLWDYYDDLTITVSCRGDSFTTSFGTVRLFGFNWVV
jgi:flagellin-like protein